MTSNEKDWTNIRVFKSTHTELEGLKIHPNQSFNEVIVMLLNEYTKEEEDE